MTNLQPKPRRSGFTLIEMLVVVAVIAALAAILLPALNKARKSAARTMVSSQLKTISVALEAYKTDFKSYPVTSTTPTTFVLNAPGMRGARALCKALMGQCEGSLDREGTFILSRPNQDGKDGFGFTIPSRSGVLTMTANDLDGKKYGPYLAADKFKVANIANVAETIDTADYTPGDVLPPSAQRKLDDRAVLLDGNGRPILYYPVLNPQPTVTVADAYVGPGPTTAAPSVVLPMYRFSDNDTWLDETKFRQALGDRNGDKLIGVGETAAVRGKPILWASGPDGVFGPNDLKGTVAAGTISDKEARNRLDDVTSFDGE